jgi:hypothetical protein
MILFLNSKRKNEHFTPNTSALPPEQQSTEENSNSILEQYWTNNVNDAEKLFQETTVSQNKSSELKSSEFLPQEVNVDWFDKDFNTIKNIDQDTLIDISQYSSGVDTVGQSLKNPSYDIRGNIPNPKNIISPFLNSSIEPDNNIKTWS